MPTLQRIPAERAVESGVRCSFCSREPAEGSDLIAGADVFICDECLATSNEIMPSGRDDQSAAADDSEQETDARPLPRRQTFFRLLTDGDVAALLTPDMMTEPMESALRRFSAGGVVQPMRTTIPVADSFFAL